MAQAAIFYDRLVLKDKRPFLALMARVAQVVEPGVGPELCLSCQMGIVAINASHLAFTHGVVIGQLK